MPEYVETFGVGQEEAFDVESGMHVSLDALESEESR